jgi:hypothetical protein
VKDLTGGTEEWAAIRAVTSALLRKRGEGDDKGFQGSRGEKDRLRKKFGDEVN